MSEKITIAELAIEKIFDIERKTQGEGRFFSLVIRRSDNEDLFEAFPEQQAREKIEKALIRFADNEARRLANGYFLPIDPKSTITKGLIEVEFLYCFS